MFSLDFRIKKNQRNFSEYHDLVIPEVFGSNLKLDLTTDRKVVLQFFITGRLSKNRQQGWFICQTVVYIPKLSLGIED